jgi:DNA-binding MarR family transcriptional regulator
MHALAQINLFVQDGRMVADEAAEVEVDVELTDAFVTASRALVAIAVRSIQGAPVAVTVQQHRILMLLGASGGLTVGEIAELAGVNQSNASRLCDRLQRLELVRRNRDRTDARVVLVALTRAGDRVVEAVMRQRRREVSEVLRRLDDGQARAAVGALAAFNRAAHEDGETDWALGSW